MADPKKKRISVINGSGQRGTIPDDPDQIRLAMTRGWLPVVDNAQGTTPDRGLIERTWDKLNEGLVSQGSIMNLLSGGRFKSQEDIQREQYRPPSEKESPDEAFRRVFSTGMVGGIAKVGSGLTSPINLATEGLSQVAKVPQEGSELLGMRIPGGVGKAARGLLTAQGFTYGGLGAKTVLENADKVGTPEGLENVLFGASQMAATAPAAGEALRVSGRQLAKIMPGIFARERSAFMAAMRPTPKETPALGEAYELLKPELQQAKIKDFAQMREFAESQRKQIAAETMAKIGLASSQGGIIDAHQVGRAVRDRVSPWMKLRSDASGNLPAEAQMIEREAANIEHNLASKKLTLVEAEQVVQDINAGLSQFRKLTPSQQYMAIRNGDVEGVMTAVKSSLQEQIEAKLSGYKNMKARYGAYKELQSQTERRMDQIDKSLGGANWAERRIAEGVGGSLGAIFSGEFLRGFADILAGRAAGDIAMESLRRPERILERSFKPAPRAIPFAGQITQPIAEQGKTEDTDVILNRLFGAPRAQ